MIAKALFVALAATGVQSLHVIQHLDSLSIPVESFIALTNLNDVGTVSSDKTQVKQSLMVDLTTNFENLSFDVFVFPGEDSDEYKCYAKSIRHQLTQKCVYHTTNTQAFLNVKSFNSEVAGLADLDGHDKLIVIDNTMVHLEGAMPVQTLTA